HRTIKWINDIMNIRYPIYEGVYRILTSKHTSGRRSGVDTANYMMARGLRGKRVVIVDDLLTSGDSLLEYAHNLERVGAIVTGAVFLARTFRMPPPATVRRVVWKHHLSALLTGK
uniref:phosphoribosyltransferase n=2 Tax=Bacteroides uniformis TaxID=820 RepID=UPI0021D15810